MQAAGFTLQRARAFIQATKRDLQQVFFSPSALAIDCLTQIINKLHKYDTNDRWILKKKKKRLTARAKDTRLKQADKASSRCSIVFEEEV